MKKTMVAVALMMVAGATTAQAGDPPTLETVANKVRYKDWGECLAQADALLTSNPASTPVAIDAGSEFLPGSHPLSEVRAECAKQYLPRAIVNLSFAGKELLEQLPKLETESDPNLWYARMMTDNCHSGVKQVISLGGDAATPIKVLDKTYRLDTIDAELCSQGDAKIAAAGKRVVAKYVGVLKSDKMKLIEKSPSGYIAVPPGEGTSDPKTLAKAKLWFEVFSRDPGDGDRCPETIYSYRRFQFDAKHKLVKQSETEYCGDPGGRALR